MKTILTFIAATTLASAAAAQDVNEAGGTQKPVGGVINANGTPQISPTQFTVSHPSTGRYIITFNKSFPKSAVCTVMPIGNSVRVVSAGVNTKTCDVIFYSNSSNVAADTLFTFVALNAG